MSCPWPAGAAAADTESTASVAERSAQGKTADIAGQASRKRAADCKTRLCCKVMHIHCEKALLQCYLRLGVTSGFGLQEQQRQILNLEHQLQNALHNAAQQKAAGQASRKRAAELQEELENNAAVFKLHYDELLAKDAEIAKLKAVIQGLSSGR